MLKTIPFLLFDGNCAEAMSFYHECLGGNLTLTKLGNTPMRDQFPPEKHEKIINAQLKNEDIEISATDWMASPTLDPILGNMSAIFITGMIGDELKSAFQKLSVGADEKTFQDLHEMPFGTYGQLYDKFGIQWIFMGTSNK